MDSFLIPGLFVIVVSLLLDLGTRFRIVVKRIDKQRIKIEQLEREAIYLKKAITTLRGETND